MPCILRIHGKKFDVSKCVQKTKIKDFKITEKGKRRFPNSKTNKTLFKTSCLKIEVSDKDFDNLQGQIKDVIKYLTKNSLDIKNILKYPGIEGAMIDFGIERRDVAIQCDYFPPNLLLLAGKMGIGLEVSMYWNMN